MKAVLTFLSHSVLTLYHRVPKKKVIITVSQNTQTDSCEIHTDEKGINTELRKTFHRDTDFHKTILAEAKAEKTKEYNSSYDKL